MIKFILLAMCFSIISSIQAGEINLSLHAEDDDPFITMTGSALNSQHNLSYRIEGESTYAPNDVALGTIIIKAENIKISDSCILKISTENNFQLINPNDLNPSSFPLQYYLVASSGLVGLHNYKSNYFKAFNDNSDSFEIDKITKNGKYQCELGFTLFYTTFTGINNPLPNTRYTDTVYVMLNIT